MPVTLLTVADVLPYRQIMLHAYEHAADAFTSTAQERALEPDSWWLQRIAHPQGLTVAFGVREGEHLVGTTALEFSPKPKTLHKALVVGVYVLPSARGRGYARALMQAAIQYCEGRPQIQVVQLDVTEGNVPAVTLYQSLGFSAYGVEPKALLTPGGFRSKVHMWREIR